MCVCWALLYLRIDCENVANVTPPRMDLLAHRIKHINVTYTAAQTHRSQTKNGLCGGHRRSQGDFGEHFNILRVYVPSMSVWEWRNWYLLTGACQVECTTG